MGNCAGALEQVARCDSESVDQLPVEPRQIRGDNDMGQNQSELSFLSQKLDDLPRTVPHVARPTSALNLHRRLSPPKAVSFASLPSEGTRWQSKHSASFSGSGSLSLSSDYPLPLSVITTKTAAKKLVERVRLLQWLDGDDYVPAILLDVESTMNPSEAPRSEARLTKDVLAKNHTQQLDAECGAARSFYAEHELKPQLAPT